MGLILHVYLSTLISIIIHVKLEKEVKKGSSYKSFEKLISSLFTLLNNKRGKTYAIMSAHKE